MWEITHTSRPWGMPSRLLERGRRRASVRSWKEPLCNAGLSPAVMAPSRCGRGADVKVRKPTTHFSREAVRNHPVLLENTYRQAGGLCRACLALSHS